MVVGTNAQVESEGIDRKSLALPGRQDDLVTAVAATGTPTVVVINAGAPVLLPWRDQVAALLVSYFGGQEQGHALADVLFGAVEPAAGCRLPGPSPRRMSPCWPPRQSMGPGVWRRHPHRLPRLAQAGHHAGVLVRPRPRLHRHRGDRCAGAGRGSAGRACRADGPGGQPRISRRQAGGPGVRREGRIRGRPSGALAGRVRPGARACWSEGVRGRGCTYAALGVLGRRVAVRAGNYVLRIGTSAVDLPLSTTVTLG